jgi:hypothetical protein
LGEETKAMSLSAPSAINLDFYQVKFDAGDLNKPSEGLSQRRDTIVIEKKGSKDSMFVQSVDLTSQPDPCRSLSVLTDSTEQSAPVNFDMSNRVSKNAKLSLGAFFK